MKKIEYVSTTMRDALIDAALRANADTARPVGTANVVRVARSAVHGAGKREVRSWWSATRRSR